MKNWKRAIIAMFCLCVVLGTTACGMGNNNTTDDKNKTNDVTDGRDNDGVINDIGDTTGNVIDDIGNGVDNMTDDITDNDSNNNNNDNIDNNTNNNTNR